jgi:hypothetical protein
LNKVVYSDTIRVGNYGYISVLDTVNENKLASRKIKENYNIPEIKETKTITRYLPPSRSLFVGGGINTSNSIGIRGIEAGILYKTKKESIFNIKAQVDLDGKPMYGFGYYTKIK